MKNNSVINPTVPVYRGLFLSVLRNLTGHKQNGILFILDFLNEGIIIINRTIFGLLRWNAYGQKSSAVRRETG